MLQREQCWSRTLTILRCHFLLFSDELYSIATDGDAKYAQNQKGLLFIMWSSYNQ